MSTDKNLQEDSLLILEKGKRGLLRILFGRTAIVILLLAVQFLFLIGIFWKLGQYIPYIFGSTLVLSILLILVIVNGPLNPSIQISWIVLILALPVFGSLLYVFVDTQLEHKRLNRRLNFLIEDTKKYLPSQEDVLFSLQQKDLGTANLASYMQKNGNFPIYTNTEISYFPLGEAKFEEMLLQLEQAKHFIFMEYFIVQEGYMWGKILKLLEKKAKEGVEVRVMYDGMCSIVLLPYDYPKKVEKLGIRCKMFSPIHVAMSTHYNNRDHRKILVIDGHTAFTGGVNLADEYINRTSRFGHWKDTALMLKGDAVRSFTLMFLQMWNISEKSEDYEKYLNIKFPPVNSDLSNGYAIPYGDSPLDNENLSEMVYMDILNRAEHYVHIMTPYLILDHEMQTALTFAAKRGVEVIILMPHIPDKKTAFALAKNHYPELIKAGVQIYEYTPGFVHAKVFVSDDKKAVVGTINLDYRSLYLHFECGVFLYETPIIDVIEEDFQDTLCKSQLITLADCKHVSLFIKLMGKVLRLFAPLM